jgi:hypothetical protein
MAAKAKIAQEAIDLRLRHDIGAVTGPSTIEEIVRMWHDVATEELADASKPAAKAA